jgi:aryl-alcohol dehydrogenase-like predicted oxidoreductase
MKNNIALGTLQFSGWYGTREDKDVIEIIKLFIENGGVYFDTAPLYGFGKSDTLLSRALRLYKRENYMIISKCGFVDLEKCTSVEEAKKDHKNTSYKAILKDCEASLERLQTDYIDIYLLHTRDTMTPLEESMSALHDLKKKGKVKNIGICNTTFQEVLDITKHFKIDYIQNRFSLINRSINKDFSTYLSNHSISVMPYRVIDYGLLTNKKAISNHVTFERDDSRNKKPDLQKDKQEIILRWTKEYLSPIADSLEITIAQLCIAWTLKQPFVSIPVIGITKKEYIAENIQASTINLTEKALKQLDLAYKVLANKILEDYNLPVHMFRGLNERYY